MGTMSRRVAVLGLGVTIALAAALALAPMAMAASIRVDDSTSRYIGDYSTVDVPFVVSGATEYVRDVRVSFYLTHTWDGDLYISLIAPDGTACVLSNRRGSSGDNFGVAAAPDSSRTTFDDAAASSLSGGLPPYVGSFRPDSPLSVFDWKSTTAMNGTWRLRVEDRAGADVGTIWAASLFVETGPDNLAPVVSAPADISAEAAGPSGAVVTFSPAVTDNVDGSITPVCSPPSGSTFPIGTTRVDVTATDAAGNTGTASFNVTVSDTTAPVVTAPGDMNVGATSASGAQASFWASSADAVDGATNVTYWLGYGTGSPVQISSPYVFPHGESVVTCVAVDNAGNTGAATFRVMVTYTGAIQQAINELDMTLPTVRSSFDRTNISDAIGHLRKALTAGYWANGSRPLPGLYGGEAVFAECRAAVEHLRRCGEPVSVLKPVVARLVSVARGIAELRIQEAQYEGVEARKLTAARAALLRGDQSAATSPLSAIDYYKEAWKQALAPHGLPR